MKRLSKKQCTPIGIDVGAQCVKAVQLTGREGASCIQAAVSIPRPESGSTIDASELRRLCDVLDRQDFIGRDVVLAAPRDKVMSGVLQLPPKSSEAPLEQLARMELAHTYKCDAGSFEMATWDVPAPVRSSNATHVMAAACEHEQADALLDTFESEGLNVRCLDVQAWALARACRPLVGESTNITGVLDLGWSAATLVVLHEDVVVYVRQLDDAGIQRLYQALAEHLDADDQVVRYMLHQVGLNADSTQEQIDQELLADARGILATHFDSTLSELRASLSYATHCYPNASIEQLLLVGGGASIPRLDEPFAADLGTQIRIVAPSDLVQCPDSILERCGDPGLVVALGLAQIKED